MFYPPLSRVLPTALPCFTHRAPVFYPPLSHILPTALPCFTHRSPHSLFHLPPLSSTNLVLFHPPLSPLPVSLAFPLSLPPSLALTLSPSRPLARSSAGGAACCCTGPAGASDNTVLELLQVAAWRRSLGASLASLASEWPPLHRRQQRRHSAKNGALRDRRPSALITCVGVIPSGPARRGADHLAR